MSAQTRVVKQVKRTLEAHPDVSAVFVVYDGNPYGVLSRLTAAERAKVIFAEGVRVKSRVCTEFPPPRNDKPDGETM